ALEVIERNARSQARLINDLLDISRITSGKLQLDRVPIDLRAVLRTAVDSARPAATARSIELTMAVDDREAWILGDAGRVEQVLGNLLSNAVKFTPRDGRIDVALHTGGGLARIAVRDSGEGIAGEFLPFVFDRFRQAQSGTNRPHGGLGLGLAVVRS